MWEFRFEYSVEEIYDIIIILFMIDNNLVDMTLLDSKICYELGTLKVIHFLFMSKYLGFSILDKTLRIQKENDMNLKNNLVK